jgi:glycosyltransferase involved in cell wall biosynthesis
VTTIRALHLLPRPESLGGTERSVLGGTERTVLDLLTSPLLAHVEQRVAFVRPGPIEDYPSGCVLSGPPSWRLPAGALLSAVAWAPNIVHGWLLQGNLLGAVIKALRPSVALVTSERNLGHTLTPTKRRFERVVAAYEDVATANSRAVRDAAIARQPRRAPHFRVIWPGVRPVPLRLEATTSTAVMVGRLHEIKDHATALRTWRRVTAQRPEARLLIVGAGPERARLEQEIERIGLRSSVVLCGYADAASYLHGARIFLSTSRAEGFSRALLEAMAGGLPAVSTAVGGAMEIASEGLKLAPIGDDAALAKHILRWLECPDQLAAASVAARATASQFSVERCHAAYAALYEELAS